MCLFLWHRNVSTCDTQPAIHPPTHHTRRYIVQLVWLFDIMLRHERRERDSRFGLLFELTIYQQLRCSSSARVNKIGSKLNTGPSARIHLQRSHPHPKNHCPKYPIPIVYIGRAYFTNAKEKQQQQQFLPQKGRKRTAGHAFIRIFL